MESWLIYDFRGEDIAIQVSTAILKRDVEQKPSSIQLLHGRFVFGHVNSSEYFFPDLDIDLYGCLPLVLNMLLD